MALSKIFPTLMKTREETKVTIKIEQAIYNVDRLHIGKGSFATVHLATDEEGTTFAAKKIRRENPKVEHLTKDIDRLLQLRHPNIVCMLDKKFEDEQIWIIMEFCPKKDLNQFLKGKTLPITKMLHMICIPIAAGLVYLHDQNIIHRDIKPDNILMDMSSTAKLTDFDLSKVLEDDYATSSMSSSAGARLYKAPEYFVRTEKHKRRYKRSIDVFAFGLTIHAVMGNERINDKLVPSVKGNYDMAVNPIGLIMCIKKSNEEVASDTDLSTATSVGEQMIVRVNQLINKMTRYEQENRPKAIEVLEQLQNIKQLKIKLVKSGTTEMQRAYSMCVNRHNQLVVFHGNGTSGLLSVPGVKKYNITIYNRQDGTVIKQIPIPCTGIWCHMMEHPTDPNYVLHANYRQCVISAINLDTVEDKTVWKTSKACKCESSGVEVLSVCKGPAGSVLALVQKGGEYCVMRLEWQSKTEEFRTRGEVELDVSKDRFFKLAEVCFVEAADILVITFRDGVYGVKLEDGSHVWEFSGTVTGKVIDPAGLCCDPEGRVYVGDGNNKRLLMLDGESGDVLHVLLEGETMGRIRDIDWSNTTPQLTVWHATPINHIYQHKIDFYPVTTGQ